MTWRLALRGVIVSAALEHRGRVCPRQDGIDIGDTPVPIRTRAPEGGTRIPSGDSGGGIERHEPQSRGRLGHRPRSGSSTGKVVINELMTRGSKGATEEFIELYIPNSCAISLGGWKVPYKSKTGGGNAVLHTFAAGQSIAAGSYSCLVPLCSRATRTSRSPTEWPMRAGRPPRRHRQARRCPGLRRRHGAVRRRDRSSGAPTNGSVGRKSDGSTPTTTPRTARASTSPRRRREQVTRLPG